MQVKLNWSKMKRFTECEIKFKVLTKYAFLKFTLLIDILFYFLILYLTFNTLSHLSSYYFAFYYFTLLFIISSHFFTTYLISQNLTLLFKSSLYLWRLSHFQVYCIFQNYLSFESSIVNSEYIFRNKNTNNA